MTISLSKLLSIVEAGMKNLLNYWRLFSVFFKIGCSTFGGGIAMIPLIQREVVDHKKWAKEEEMIEYLAIAQSVPGVVAINSSIFVGNKVSGISGAFFAVLGVTLPAVVSILLILAFLSGLENNVYVEKIFSGIRAATVALVLITAIKMGKIILKGKVAYLIAVTAFVIIVIFNISAAWAILTGGVVGFLVYFFSKRRKG